MCESIKVANAKKKKRIKQKSFKRLEKIFIK